MSPETLRAARPVAPAALRERVQSIAAAGEPAHRRRPLPWRRVSLAAVPTALTAAAIAGVAIGLTGRSHPSSPPVSVLSAGATHGSGAATPQERTLVPSAKRAAAPPFGVAPAPGRLQDYRATLELEVPNARALSDRTKRAVRIARALGGTVSQISVSTAGARGSALLVLLIPTARVTTAIDELGALGRIVAQHLDVLDVERRIDALRARVVAASGDERTRLQKQLFAEVRRARLSIVSVAFRTPPPVVTTPKPHHESMAHRILRAEGRIGLYLGLVGGPVLALVALAWLVWRGGRRIAERRLLGT